MKGNIDLIFPVHEEIGKTSAPYIESIGREAATDSLGLVPQRNSLKQYQNTKWIRKYPVVNVEYSVKL